jgi:hypothetical protein
MTMLNLERGEETPAHDDAANAGGDSELRDGVEEILMVDRRMGSGGSEIRKLYMGRAVSVARCGQEESWVRLSRVCACASAYNRF